MNMQRWQLFCEILKNDLVLLKLKRTHVMIKEYLCIGWGIHFIHLVTVHLYCELFNPDCLTIETLETIQPKTLKPWNIQPQTLQPTGEKWGVEYFFFEMFGLEDSMTKQYFIETEIFNSWLHGCLDQVWEAWVVMFCNQYISNLYSQGHQTCFNTSYLTDSYIGITLEMESVSKNTIFGLKRMVKSSLEKFVLKSLHVGR